MKMEVTPGAKPDSAVVYALLSGNESALWAMDGYDAAATVLLNRPLPPSTANVTTTSFAIRNSVLYVLTSDGIVTREPLTAAGLPSSGGHSSSFNLTQLVYAASCQVSLALARPLNSSMPSRAVLRSSRVCSLFFDSPATIPRRPAGTGQLSELWAKCHPSPSTRKAQHTYSRARAEVPGARA